MTYEGLFEPMVPCSFMVDGQYCNSAEQYMMAEKARIFGDEEIRQQILAEYSQMAMKKQLATGFWWKRVQKIPFGAMVSTNLHSKQYNLVNGKAKTFWGLLLWKYVIF